MNERISKLLVVIKNNSVVAYGTNYQELTTMLSKVEPKARNYFYYYREFKKADSFTWEGYHFQRLV